MKTRDEIFLVEDDQFDAHLIRKKLEAENPDLDVKTFYTGESFRSKIIASQKVPRLVILDYHLPDASGLELVQFLKSVDPSAKILVVSGEKAEYLIDECIGSGVEKFIHKNNRTLNRLLHEVKQVLGIEEEENEAFLAFTSQDLQQRKRLRERVPMSVLIMVNILISVLAITICMYLFS